MAWPCVAAAGVVRSCSVGDENSFGLNSSGVLIVPQPGVTAVILVINDAGTTDLPLVLAAIPWP